MRYSELNEISITGSLNRDDAMTFGFIPKSSVVGTLDGVDILRYTQNNQSIYFLGTEPLAHCATQDNSGHIWCMELRSYVTGMGYGSKLMAWVVKNVSPLYVDRELTIQSANMIEKMIRDGVVNASVVDIENGTVTAYKGDNIPMYDAPIGNRPLRAPGKEMLWTWLLETRVRRGGILQEYVRYGPTYFPIRG